MLKRFSKILLLTGLLSMMLPVLCSAGAVSKDGYYNGIPLWGKVKVVEHNADIKVQVVKSFPDLKVKKVTSFPDFTIQYVNSFPDIKIQFVDAFPGVN